MKAYKIDLSGFTGKVREVVSEAVQKKAFELGYDWFTEKKELLNLNEPWLTMKTDGEICWSPDGEVNKTAITVDDFLALETAKEPEFKATMPVLVRYNDTGIWDIDIYGYQTDGDHVCSGGVRHPQCIPYEGNEHLIGTTDSQK